MKKLLYPYARFSSEKQGKGASLKRQIYRARKYAAENGYEVVDLDLNDKGLSAFTGKNVSHGALGVFLEAIENDIVPTDGSAYLCIEQIDRLSRQDIDSASTLFKSILRKNVNIITLMDNKIYTKQSLNSFVDIMYSLFLMEQANLESQKKSERILDSFDQRFLKVVNSEKVQFSGMLPGWIDNQGTKEETNFVFNEKVKVVQKIFEMYGNEGKSLRDITKWLDSNNIDQIARKRHKNFTNRWSSGKVSHLLKNRCVLGELHIKREGEIIKNYYPAAVEKELFDRVQSISKRKVKIKSAGRKSINIFTGKTFCGKCGQKVYFETDDKVIKGKKYLYFTLKCSARRYGGCDSKTVTYDHFLSSHPNEFNIFGTPFEYPKHLLEKKRIAIIEKEEQLKKQNNKLSDLENYFLNNEEIDTEFYLKSGTKIKSNIRSLKREIDDLKYEYNTYSNKYEYEEVKSRIDKFYLDRDPDEIDKAKKIIDRNYSAIIIFSDQKQAVCLRYNGLYEFVNWGENTDTSLLIDNFSKYTESLFEQYLGGKIDGKFTEVLNSIFNWGEEKLYKKELTTLQINEIEQDPTNLSKYDFGFFILQNWKKETLQKYLKKHNLVSNDFDYKSYGKYLFETVFKMKSKRFEMTKNQIDQQK
ncbi:recombinase family protein [Pseudoalteromonas sp. JC28]|uniref:recombinase family protein n=1 Tax=Pseudoalteromonas sp. JC28 TaxID=2267617 RepID=UPI001572E521|nr:recombinase family protein [Pseudoalteromonas sp. JC28]NSY35437.1 recombinase family protein [Pseudoalteromonas sp. JC28]